VILNSRANWALIFPSLGFRRSGASAFSSTDPNSMESVMLKSQLLDAIRTEICKHDLSHFQNEERQNGPSGVSDMPENVLYR
jgi:hypothetical protein